VQARLPSVYILTFSTLFLTSLIYLRLIWVVLGQYPELAIIKSSKSEAEIWVAWHYFGVGFGLLAWWRRNQRLDLGDDWGCDGLVLKAKRKVHAENRRIGGVVEGESISF
jgi:hypothetical protein